MNKFADSDIQRCQAAEEGQFFDQKSAFDRASGRPKQRKAADIVETLSTMANADGGELVIGIENDGAITGVPHGEDRAFCTPGGRLLHQSPIAPETPETGAMGRETDTMKP